MDFSTLVQERRSIRSYQPSNALSRSTLDEIMKTALQAPSWKNTQTGRYYVASSEEMIAHVKSCLPLFNQKSTQNAVAYLVTTYEKGNSGFTKGEPDNELGDKWGAYDLGLQNAYLILKAKELGLDSLIMGLRDSDLLRKVFDIPDTEEVGPVIALGYREGDALLRRRKEVEDITKIY